MPEKKRQSQRVQTQPPAPPDSRGGNDQRLMLILMAVIAVSAIMAGARNAFHIEYNGAKISTQVTGGDDRQVGTGGTFSAKNGRDK